MKNPILRAVSFVLRLISVPKCVICGELLVDEGEICADCLKTWKKARLVRCPVYRKTARACRCKPFSLYHTDTVEERPLLSLAFFGKSDSTDVCDEAVRRIVYSVKRSRSRSAVRFASRELALEVLRLIKSTGDSISEWKITYPPRLNSEKRKYGFDQAKQMAKLISEYTGVPVVSCFDRRGGTVQKALNAVERRNNAEVSLAMKKELGSVSGKYIIVDDVITTGATVDACAALLRNAGATTAFPVSIARTKKKKIKVRRSPAARPWFCRPAR